MKATPIAFPRERTSETEVELGKEEWRVDLLTCRAQKPTDRWDGKKSAERIKHKRIF